MSPLKSIGAVLLLVLVYLVLFATASQLVMPAELLEKAAASGAGEPSAMGGMLVMASIDVAFMLGVVMSSRLRGAQLWLLTTALFWGAKTFTSQLEAWYFMPNVDASLVPALLLMTVPVAVVVPLLTVVFFGRWQGQTESNAWHVPPMSAGQQAWKWLVLSALVYPVLFFVAGYYVAFSNEEVRAFYGGVFEPTFVGHLSALFRSDPLLYPFEVLRGALWVVMAVALLWTTQGKPWVGAVLVVVLFTLVQNGVHLIPNPLMSPTVRTFHFVETVSSNAVFAVLISWLMSRAHFVGGSKTDHHGPATPRLSSAS
ncbi:MAG: hypothetical protein Q8L48_32640 [Archangium sp.]|nr:hypothetical protein [Archangium sp.]